MVRSSLSTGSSRPEPTPTNEYAQRLEHVRQLRGVEELKEFWRRIVDRYPEGEVRSYAAVRTYHFDRDPPVDYIRQVSEVYNVPLEYLVLGIGEASLEDRSLRLGALVDRLEAEGHVVEFAGGQLVHPDDPPAWQSYTRLMGAATEVAREVDEMNGARRVIEAYLHDLIVDQGPEAIGWEGPVERDDLDRVKDQIRTLVDRLFGPTLENAAQIPPAELVAAVLARAIPLYLTAYRDVRCERCGTRTSRRLLDGACRACGHAVRSIL